MCNSCSSETFWTISCSNTDYLQIFARSIGLAATTAALTLVIAFPIALWMAFQPPHRRTFLLFVVTVPFWTNLLVRNYAWILLLRNGGVIDRLLQARWAHP